MIFSVATVVIAKFW